MTDSELLISTISKCGISQAKIARELGITRQGLWKKINNRSEFKQSEIEKLARLLNLDFELNGKIFFKNFVGDSSTSNDNQ